MLGFESASSCVAAERFLFEKYAYLLNPAYALKEPDRRKERRPAITPELARAILLRVRSGRFQIDVAAEMDVSLSVVSLISRGLHPVCRKLGETK